MNSRRVLGDLLSPLRSRLVRGERMVPGYLVVGTKRGGSTSLAEWIATHPEVGPCAVGKGTHYFDVNHGRGPAWYAAQFPALREGYRLTGESSPYYMFHPLAPEWIARELPAVRIVVCLREPVARAWSHHAYEVRRGRETESFDRALALEEARLAGEEERLRADPTYAAEHWRYHSYLRRGHYAEQLTVLHRLFGPERVLVVQSEALFAEPDVQMDRVFAFLGLSPHRHGAWPTLNAGRPHGDMTDATAARLADHFAPHNDALYDLPGVDFTWGEGRRPVDPPSAAVTH